MHSAVLAPCSGVSADEIAAEPRDPEQGRSEGRRGWRVEQEAFLFLAVCKQRPDDLAWPLRWTPEISEAKTLKAALAFLRLCWDGT